jgi:Tfp pilus assembly protein PilN
MLDNTQQWHLFGYDMRRIGHHWQVAWAEFLWGDRSPVRARLDDVVRVEGETGAALYHAGQPVTEGEASCEAVLLPDELVLFKSLNVPRAAEDELDAVMALEVMANSPFPADDTAAGWTLVGRDEKGLRLQLAIVSSSAVMRYLGSRHDLHDPHAREVWAMTGEQPVVLRGFGESRRLQRYQRRLLRMAGWLGVCLLTLLLILALLAGGKYLQLQQYETLADTVQREAADVIRLRESLSAANQTVAGVNELLNEFPSPHVELARLTRLLGDDAYIAQLTMRGQELRLRGRAANAAGVMEELIRQEAFAVVTDQGITKVGDTGFEQFNVSIQLQDRTP